MSSPRHRQVQRFGSYLSTDGGARSVFRVGLALGIVALVVIGSKQWFIRDDWALVITRTAVRDQVGWKDWLFYSQDGHWLTVPVLVYRAIENVFGLDSYLPFLIPNLIVHVAAVLLVRRICVRCGASAWTTTLVSLTLLVFGAGWENVVFAVQVSYNLSLVAFLAAILLVDHEGPVDRRDILASVLAVVGVMSSGFAPIFIGGIVVLMVLRRRWLALAVVALPQTLAYLWWYAFWESGSPSAVEQGSRGLIPAFVAQGLGSTMRSLVVIPGLAGVALLGIVGIGLWSGRDWRAHSIVLTLWATGLAMLTGIGLERTSLGVATAASSRYQYMTAMLLVPVLALAVDQLVHIAREARWAARAVLSLAVLVNLGWLIESGDDYADRSGDEKVTFELIAGSGLIDQADPNRVPEANSPDVTVARISWMVEHHAINPRVPQTVAEITRVRLALGLDA